MPQPYEVSESEVLAHLDDYVDEVFSTLESQFLTLPRGEGFIEYAVFEQGYEALRRGTRNFDDLTPPAVLEIVYKVPVAFVVLRSILGFTPPEWAHVATTQLGMEIPQGAVRSIDRNIRLAPLTPIDHPSPSYESRIRALVETACRLIQAGAPRETPEFLHRLDKADTRGGVASLKTLADLGVPYAMLLYERFLGRPFAGHRDSVSELVGDVLESAIEAVLHGAGISFRKTRRAERLEGFDQAPDFIVPSEFNPKVVIEAKISEDDGTARDKVTRVQHLHTISRQGVKESGVRFQVVACIAGRGFKVRREDMKKLLIATGGKVFTLNTIRSLVDCTALDQFRTKGQGVSGA